MKKVYNGRIYDTAKSILIGSADSPGSQGDLDYWAATLYRTPRSGRFFLRGEGGPQTRWAQSEGQNTWTSGEDIIPLSYAEALQWAEANLDPGTICQHFEIEEA